MAEKDKYYNIQDNAPDIIQETVGPFFDIPHPTPIQVAQDVFSLIRTLPNKQLDFTVEKKSNYSIQSIPVELQPDTEVMISKLGTPIYDKLEFKIPSGSINYTSAPNIVDNGTFIYFRYEDIMLTVNQPKKIVSTEIAGNNGSVKEFIGLGDYNINIAGRLTSTYNKRPIDDLINLQKALNVNKTIAISCAYLNNLGITDIIVTNYDLPQLEGEFSTQYFSITAVSDFRPENDFIKFTGVQ